MFIYLVSLRIAMYLYRVHTYVLSKNVWIYDITNDVIFGFQNATFQSVTDSWYVTTCFQVSVVSYGMYDFLYS